MQEYFIRIKVACENKKLAREMQRFVVERLKYQHLLPTEFQVLDSQLLEVDNE